MDSTTSAGLVPLRSEDHTSELQSPCNLVCRLLLEKKKKKYEQFKDNIHQQQLDDCDARTVYCSWPVCTSVRQFGSCLRSCRFRLFFFFFFNDTATTEIYTLSLHDALPIYLGKNSLAERQSRPWVRSA